MARKRMIDPSIWASTTFEGLSCNDARLLVIWLFSNADDEGRLRGSLPVIRGSAFTFSPKITDKDIDGWLNELVALGFIARYEHEGFAYIQIWKWHDYQSIKKPTPSHLPAPKPDEITSTELVGDEFPTSSPLVPPNRMEWKRKERAAKPTRVSPTPPDYASLRDKIPEGRVKVLWGDYEAMCAAHRAKGIIAESVLYAMLDKLLAAMEAEKLTSNQVCYGLEAAITKQADNINYVLNAARGYGKDGKQPNKPPPKVTPLFKPKPGVEVSEEIA